MKIITTVLVTTALGLASLAANGAELVNSAPADQQRMGVISTTAGTNLTSLENKLAAEADANGAKSFEIISTTGQNRLHGTAVIYQ